MDKAQNLFGEFCDSLLVESQLPSDITTLDKKINKAYAALEEYQRTYDEVVNRYNIALESGLSTTKYSDAMEELGDHISDIKKAIESLTNEKMNILDSVNMGIIGEESYDARLKYAKQAMNVERQGQILKSERTAAAENLDNKISALSKEINSLYVKVKNMITRYTKKPESATLTAEVDKEYQQLNKAKQTKNTNLLASIKNKLENVLSKMEEIIRSKQTATVALAESFTAEEMNEIFIALEGAEEVQDSDEDEKEESSEKETKDSEDNIDYISKAKECITQLKGNALKLLAEKESKLKEDDVKGKQDCEKMRKTLDNIWNDNSDIPDEETYKNLQKKMGKAIAILTPAMEEIFHDDKIQEQLAVMKSLLTLEDPNEDAFNHAMESIQDYIDHMIWLERANYLREAAMTDDDTAIESATEEKKDESKLVFDDLEKAKHNLDLVIRMADASIDRLYAFGDDYGVVSLRKQCSDLIARCIKYQNLNDESDINLLEVSKRMLDNITQIDSEISMLGEMKSEDEPEVVMTAEEAYLALDDEIAEEGLIADTVRNGDIVITEANKNKSNIISWDTEKGKELNSLLQEITDYSDKMNKIKSLADSDQRIDEAKSDISKYTTIINKIKKIVDSYKKYVNNEENKKAREKLFGLPAASSFTAVEEYVKDACLVMACEALEKYFGDDFLSYALEGKMNGQGQSVHSNDAQIMRIQGEIQRLKKISDGNIRYYANNIENKELGRINNNVMSKKDEVTGVKDLEILGNELLRMKNSGYTSSDIARIESKIRTVEDKMTKGFNAVVGKITKTGRTNSIFQNIKDSVSVVGRSGKKFSQAQDEIDQMERKQGKYNTEIAGIDEELKRLDEKINKEKEKTLSSHISPENKHQIQKSIDDMKQKRVDLVNRKNDVLSKSSNIDQGRLEDLRNEQNRAVDDAVNKNARHRILSWRHQRLDKKASKGNIKAMNKREKVANQISDLEDKIVGKVVDESGARKQGFRSKDNREAVANAEQQIRDNKDKFLQKSDAEKAQIDKSIEKSERRKEWQRQEDIKKRVEMSDVDKKKITDQIETLEKEADVYRADIEKSKDENEKASKRRELARVNGEIKKLRRQIDVSDEEMEEYSNRASDKYDKDQKKEAEANKAKEVSDARTKLNDARKAFAMAVSAKKPKEEIDKLRSEMNAAEKDFNIKSGKQAPDPEEEKDDETGITKTQQSKTFRNIPYNVAKQRLVTDSKWRGEIETWYNEQKKSVDKVLKKDPEDQKSLDLREDLDNWKKLLDATKTSFERQSRDDNRDNTPEERAARLQREKEEADAKAAEDKRKQDEEKSAVQNKARNKVITLENRCKEARQDLIDYVKSYDNASNRYEDTKKGKRKIQLSSTSKTQYEDDIREMVSRFETVKAEYLKHRKDYNANYPDDEIPEVRFSGYRPIDQDVKDFLSREKISVVPVTESFTDIDFTDEEFELWCASEGFDLSGIENYTEKEIEYLTIAIGCRLNDAYIASESFGFDPELKDLLFAPSMAYESNSELGVKNKVEEEMKSIMNAITKLKEDADKKKRQADGYIGNIRNLIDLLNSAELKKMELGSKYLKARAERKDLKNNLAHKQYEKILDIHKEVTAMYDSNVWEKDISYGKLKRKVARMAAKLASNYTKFKRIALKEIKKLNENKRVAKMTAAQRMQGNKLHEEALKLNERYVGPSRKAIESVEFFFENDFEECSELHIAEACEALAPFVLEDPELSAYAYEAIYEEFSEENNE